MAEEETAILAALRGTQGIHHLLFLPLTNPTDTQGFSPLANLAVTHGKVLRGVIRNPEKEDGREISIRDEERTTTRIVKSASISAQSSHRSPCVYARHDLHGWGNEVMRVLTGLMANAEKVGTGGIYTAENQKQHVFPCLMGYGGLIGNLLKNVHNCPEYWNASMCRFSKKTVERIQAPYNKIRKRENRSLALGENEFDLKNDAIRKYIAKYQERFPELFEINKTFADKIFRETDTPFKVRDLLKSQFCAVHIRFGDFHSRKQEEMSSQERELWRRELEMYQERGRFGRACKKPDKVHCFGELYKRIVHQICPSASIPTYIAADVAEFLPYFCQREEKNQTGRVIWSSCTPNTTQTNHIVDVKLVDATNPSTLSAQGLPTIQTLLSDWVALAMAKNLTTISVSTFSESAQLPWAVA